MQNILLTVKIEIFSHFLSVDLISLQESNKLIKLNPESQVLKEIGASKSSSYIEIPPDTGLIQFFCFSAFIQHHPSGST